MSILVLFLLVGVATSRSISYYDNDNEHVLQPILTRSQERRICAELCMAGLGGEACGDDCVDFVPEGIPMQSSNASDVVRARAKPRQAACPVLCRNSLGIPLCTCDNITRNARVDFVQICSFYCVEFEYHIYGCQKCELYKNQTLKAHSGMLGMRKNGVNWDAWCLRKCTAGEGGAACACDLLPMLMAPTNG